MSGALGGIRGTSLLAHAPKTGGEVNVNATFPQGQARNIIALAPAAETLPNLVKKVNQILKCLKGAGLVHFK
jgi:Holliday junction resolvasome RuvABC endonuclease subunit